MTGHESTRLAKRTSGNLSGRPRKAKEVVVSAFHVIVERTLEVTEHGLAPTLSIEEGLALAMFNNALKGSRLTQRKVIAMIEKRERWLADRRSKTLLPV